MTRADQLPLFFPVDLAAQVGAPVGEEHQITATAEADCLAVKADTLRNTPFDCECNRPADLRVFAGHQDREKQEGEQ
jgi:hypothetical protein